MGANINRDGRSSSFHRWLYIPTRWSFRVRANLLDHRTGVSHRRRRFGVTESSPLAWQPESKLEPVGKRSRQAGGLGTNISRDASERTYEDYCLLVCVFGWLIAVLSVKVPGVYCSYWSPRQDLSSPPSLHSRMSNRGSSQRRHWRPEGTKDAHTNQSRRHRLTMLVIYSGSAWLLPANRSC